MNKLYFLTFANKKLKRSSKRIVDQALKFDFFDDIFSYNEDNLDIKFKEKHKGLLNEKIRGYGYWIWKPKIILEKLKEVKNNDIILYTDAGCHFNNNGKDRFNDYLNIVKNDECGILAFRYDNNIFDTKISVKPFILNWTNRKFITQELFLYMNLDNEDVKNKDIVAAGILFIKKTKKSMQIIEEWLSIMENNYHLYDGTYDKRIADKHFITSRHDQSIFSLLCEKYNIKCLSGYEHYFPTNSNMSVNWNILNQFPIHAKRDKDFGFITNIIEKIKYKLNILK